MDDPVDEDTLAGALRCPVEQVRARRWPSWPRTTTTAGPASTLREVGEGWRLYTREEHAARGRALAGRRASAAG